MEAVELEQRDSRERIYFYSSAGAVESNSFTHMIPKPNCSLSCIFNENEVQELGRSNGLNRLIKDV